MNTEQIRSNIDRYFAGESSQEEEKILRRYFSQEDEKIAPELLPYRELFRFFALEAEQEPVEGFAERLEEALLAESKRRRLSPRRLSLWLGRVAAVGLLAFALWYFLPAPEPAVKAEAAIDWSKYEPETPEEAYKVLREALLKTSGELNRGAIQAAEGMDHMQELGRFFK